MTPPGLHPNPRGYYGDDGRLFLRRVAESLTEAGVNGPGPRRLTDREIDEMMNEPRLGDIARRLYQEMNGAEKRKFRHRLLQYSLSNDEVQGLANLLPDAPEAAASTRRHREARRSRREAAWCG